MEIYENTSDHGGQHWMRRWFYFWGEGGGEDGRGL